MIYQIVTLILLIYTVLVCLLGMSIVYLLEIDSPISLDWYKELSLSKDEAIRRISFTVNTHFILMLVCASVLTYGEYNVF